MSDRHRIDVLEFAKAGSVLEGVAQVASLARLQDVLSDPGGNVAYSIRGSVDGEGRPRLSIELGGTLALHCQRCLGPVVHCLELRRELRIVPNTSALPDVANEEEDVDDVVLPPQLDALEWVEDEILLGLPLSPRHDEDACEAPSNPAQERTGTMRALAGLAGLGKGTRNANDF